MKLSNRESLLLGLLTCVLLGFILNYFAYQPIVNRKSQLQNDHDFLAQKINDAEDKLRFIQEAQNQGQDIRADYQKMRSRVPSQPMIPEIISFLELAAAEANANLISVKYKQYDNCQAKDELDTDTGNSNQIGKISMEVTARGGRFNIMSFLLTIENSPRLYIIDDLIMSTDPHEISTGQTGSDFGEKPIALDQMCLKLKINAYYSI